MYIDYENKSKFWPTKYNLFAAAHVIKIDALIFGREISEIPYRKKTYTNISGEAATNLHRPNSNPIF